MTTEYVLVTHQPGALYPEPQDNAYTKPGQTPQQLEQAGHLLADGAEPPMTFLVIALQPAEWGSL